MSTIAARDASVSPLSFTAPRAGAWTAAQLVIAGCLLVVAASCALSIDLPLARWIELDTLPKDFKRILALAEVFGWGGTASLIILTAAILDPRAWRVLPGLVVCALGSGLVANGAKHLIARDRPTVANLGGGVEQTFGAWLPKLQGKLPVGRKSYQVQSFPSGHAATAAGLAIGLAALYPRGRWLFIAFAVLASLQRMETRAHFASDVLAGAAIGCLISAAWMAGAPTRRRWGLKIDFV